MEFIMGKSLVVSLIGLSLMFISGCTSNYGKINPETKEAMIIDNSLPKWVINPQIGIESGIATIGQADYSKYQDIMMDEATLMAEAAMASLLGKKIDDYQTRTMSNTKVDVDESYAKTFKRATRSVVKGIEIVGANRINMYQSEKTGILYVRIMISPLSIVSNIEDIQEELKEKYKKAGIVKKTAEKMTEGIMEEAQKEWSK